MAETPKVRVPKTAKKGDVVEIAECRPRSALKRWELVKVVKKANQVAVQNTPAVTENATA